jgi:hypothetical protein
MKFLKQRDLREKRLQEDLEKEKIRFSEASKRALLAIQRDLVAENWVKAYPVESITLIALAGFAAGYTIAKSQTRPPLDNAT